MAAKGKIVNTFRIFIDLQGYSVSDIPVSFLSNECVRFYLTERNNEDMEGFNDVWANILNDDLLNAKDLYNVPLLIDSRPSSRSSSMLNPLPNETPDLNHRTTPSLYHSFAS